MGHAVRIPRCATLSKTAGLLYRDSMANNALSLPTSSCPFSAIPSFRASKQPAPVQKITDLRPTACSSYPLTPSAPDYLDHIPAAQSAQACWRAGRLRRRHDSRFPLRSLSQTTTPSSTGTLSPRTTAIVSNSLFRDPQVSQTSLSSLLRT